MAGAHTGPPGTLGVKGQTKGQPRPRGLGRALYWHLGVLGLRKVRDRARPLLPTPRLVSPRPLLRRFQVGTHDSTLPVPRASSGVPAISSFQTRKDGHGLCHRAIFRTRHFSPLLALPEMVWSHVSLSQTFQKFPSISEKKPSSRSFAIAESLPCASPPQLHLLSPPTTQPPHCSFNTGFLQPQGLGGCPLPTPLS